ncbi:uncharacterized protein LOC127750839 [Frankliniella occidentalis]|uniref:ATP-dependent DNA helicase n=1 Tax=Frankliniella occidentalis TaxID=133901 RepID=A0A9C6XSE5_FRAOC|nr:uncharacterized protein LOC127750839 [Frankliniella occidentalis]
MDPLSVPEELLGLSYIEKQLIARIYTVMSLYRFKTCQYKYKGHVINFTQDVQQVADKLPHLVADLNNVIIVKLHEKIFLQDFVVRKDKVLNALLWLKQHNPNYSDLVIDYERVNLLPVNDNVYNQLKTLDEDNNTKTLGDYLSEANNATDSEDDSDQDENDDINLSFTDVPDILNSSLKKSIDKVLIWPSIGKTPVNEFSSPGFLSMAFPHLYPYGKGDFSMPREKKIHLKDYIKHLMLYKDQRFAQDERFRYFIMNSEMRWAALNIGNIYVKKNSFFSKMSVIQLKDFLKKNPAMVNQVMHFGSRLRTTKSYWKSRCGELLDMVNQIGTPTVFFTLSSADFQWPDLYRLLGHDVKSLSVKEKSDLLSKNSLIADSFFYARSKFFLEKSFKNHFNVTDIWYRYEFQHRGSIHVHGLAWFKNAPKITKGMTDKEKKTVLEYYTNLISCDNPDVNLTPSMIHPCQLSLDDIDDFDYDMSQLVNYLQRHTKCRKDHCLRKTSKTKTLTCRYGFPKDLVQEPELIFKGDEVVDIMFSRNDNFVNKYNEWILQTWRSNIDVSPILSQGIVYKYIAKYASKSEPKSLSYNEILSAIIEKKCEAADPCKKAIRKLLLSSCGDRDYCAQEVFHYLMGYKFYHSSRDFVVINLRCIDWVNVSSVFNNSNLIEMYSKRPQEFGKLSLFELLKYYKILSGSWVHRKKKGAIVRYFPRPVKNENKATFYEYMSQIFYPWRMIDDVEYVNEEMMMHTDNLIHKFINKNKTQVIDHIDTESSSDSDSDSEKSMQHSKNLSDNESVLSNFNPNNVHKNIDIETSQKNQWDKLSGKITIETVQSVNEMLKTYFYEQDQTDYDVKLLNHEQKKVFDFISSLTIDRKTKKVMTSQFCIVQGMPGTGKTYLLKMCVKHLQYNLGHSAVKVVAPTGVAAKLVNGNTIHSFLSLGRYGFNVDSLSGIDLHSFKEKHEGLKFLFIDECSMVGLRMLACLEKRCRELTDDSKTFGGLQVFFFGDYNQLCPIGDQPLYSETNIYSQNNSLLERGKLLLNEITNVFILNICHRFANQEYVEFLKRVSVGRCVEADVLSFRKRCINRLSNDEKQTFKNSLYITSTNERAFELNMSRLKDLNEPIAFLKAQNNNKVAFLSSDDLADGLVNVLYISKNSKVMLRKNLNISRGLVNGAIGIVRHIIYEKNKQPPSLPMCVLVQFESVVLHDLKIKYVPIVPHLTSWYKNGILCSRYQLPLTLCWACTIHKSQGLSLLSVILDAGTSEFALGLLYVALSRVSDKKNLCLISYLTLERLNSVKKSVRFRLRRKFLHKLKRIANL